MLVPEHELTPTYAKKKKEVSPKVGGNSVIESFRKKQEVSPKVGNDDNESFMKKKAISPEIVQAYQDLFKAKQKAPKPPVIGQPSAPSNNPSN